MPLIIARTDATSPGISLPVSPHSCHETTSGSTEELEQSSRNRCIQEVENCAMEGPTTVTFGLVALAVRTPRFHSSKYCA